MAELTVPSEAFIHTSFSADEIDGGEERLIPGLFDQGSGMRRFATPEDRALRAGFTRVENGSGSCGTSRMRASGMNERKLRISARIPARRAQSCHSSASTRRLRIVTRFTSAELIARTNARSC